MRAIKFRAWHKGLKEMHFCDWMGNLDKFWAYIMTDPDAFEVMQFTGLHDKNGKEIYEGDIVKLGNNHIHEGVLCQCKCLDNRVAFCYQFLTGENKGKWTDMVDDWRTYEVIGNIYENPELLTSKPLMREG